MIIKMLQKDTCIMILTLKHTGNCSVVRYSGEKYIDVYGKTTLPT